MTFAVAIIHRGSLCEELVSWLRMLPADVPIIRARGDEIAAQRNACVRSLPRRCDALLFVDSDMVPTPDALSRLFTYADRHAVLSAVMLDRRTHEVCATRTFEPTVRYRLDELPTTGAVPVLAAGTGFMLIRREVFSAVGEPWFTCGQLVADCITEDTEFCLRAAEHGFIPHLVCDARVGHVVRGVLWPSDDNVVRVQWDGTPWSESIEALR